MARKKKDEDGVESPLQEEEENKEHDSKQTVRDKLVNAIYKEINSSENSFGAFFLDDPQWSPTDISDWVSTGNPVLDVIISNRKNGGIPVGRIIEINGLESSGKSLLIGHILKETQAKGGIPIYIDTEHAMDRDFLKAIGVDFGNFIYAPIPIIEDVFQTIENIVEKIRSSDNNKLVTIAVDSVMGATNRVEDEADFTKPGFGMQKAQILSQAMRKITKTVAQHRIALIFANQLRTNVGVTYGDPWTTSGGKAIAFHSSLRLRLKMVNRIKSSDDVVGVRTNCKVIKSRIGPPFRDCDFDIYFDRGIDEATTWFETGKKYKIIVPAKKLKDETKPAGPDNKLETMGGGWMMIKGDPDMERFQSSSIRKKILENPVKKQMLYDVICDAVIMKYIDRQNLSEIDTSEIKFEEPTDD